PTPVPYGQQAGGAIEAGCSYTANDLPAGAPGATFQVACPPGCADTGGLWGTDVYTADSSICRAGIHAGAISTGGGVVPVQVQDGRPAYRGSARNGIQSNDFRDYGKSFAVMTSAAPAGGPPPGYPPPSPQGYPPQAGALAASGVIEAGCSYRAIEIVGGPGTTRVVNCPADCASAGGGLWGTDVYTGDSAICLAAIHAGLIPPAGGNVAVILEGGRPAYRGSTRHGVQSSDYGSYASSFRLQRP
ncbi:MAG TPA: LCCL domain-containing protein, partial [Polyangia bacterium]|nr:LCCL domain-containing protein [Polyangia bacterium]